MDKVTISNLQGESGNANIVRYFQNNGMEYLIYSLNEVDESGYTRLYVANIKGIDGNYTAETLNEAEWTEIKNLVKIIVKANKENLPVPVQDLNPHKIKNIILKDKKIFKLNTPLVNDLAANKPNFESTDDTSSESQSGLVQPAFEMPSTPTFDFSGTNISNNGISQNANLESRIKELEEENKRLAGEIDKYKSIIVNIKETIEN